MLVERRNTGLALQGRVMVLVSYVGLTNRIRRVLSAPVVLAVVCDRAVLRVLEADDAKASLQPFSVAYTRRR